MKATLEINEENVHDQRVHGEKRSDEVAIPPFAKTNTKARVDDVMSLGAGDSVAV